MMITASEICDIVDELNDVFVDSIKFKLTPYEYKNFGWQNSYVYFMGHMIWHELDDDFDGGDFKQYLIDESNDLLQILRYNMEKLNGLHDG